MGHHLGLDCPALLYRMEGSRVSRIPEHIERQIILPALSVPRNVSAGWRAFSHAQRVRSDAPAAGLRRREDRLLSSTSTPTNCPMSRDRSSRLVVMMCARPVVVPAIGFSDTTSGFLPAIWNAPVSFRVRRTRAGPTFHEESRRAGKSEAGRTSQRYLLNRAAQFSTTTIGRSCGAPSGSHTRNRRPSRPGWK